jgi:hypothetical protein
MFEMGVAEGILLQTYNGATTEGVFEMGVAGRILRHNVQWGNHRTCVKMRKDFATQRTMGQPQYVVEMGVDKSR